MKISKGIYKVSGVEYETNSNIYAVSYEGGIVLIDSGYQEEQWERMQAALKLFDMKFEDVTHVFVTHSHFDHAGNVWRFNRAGCRVLASGADADKIEHGNPEMERLFGAAWICGKVDQIIQDGDVFEFPGGVRIVAIATPGHCAGAITYLIETGGEKALATGDLFFIIPHPPEDKDDVELGYMGSEDFDLEQMIASLDRLRNIETDFLLPGHYYTYYGKNIKRICDKAYEQALALRKTL